MTRYDRRAQALAACLSALAGYVDAFGFTMLRGFFVSFMSGNSTRMAVGITLEWKQASEAASLIVSFLAGVIIGSLAGHAAGRVRGPAVLLLVAAFLAIAAAFGMAGSILGSAWAMAMAMGTENAVFERDGDVHIGLTYMTGALVKCGQRIAVAVRGGDRFGWVPYLLLWLGLVTGAVIGALVYLRIGSDGLWLASAAAIVLAVTAAAIDWA